MLTSSWHTAKETVTDKMVAYKNKIKNGQDI